MFRTALLFAATLIAATACVPLCARPLVQVDIVDRHRSETLTPHRHRGDDWIAGRAGHPYSVRLTNTTAERVLVVLSVDGINAVTGETADPSQAGYVLGPWQSTEVTGWRKSLDDVAQFVFTALPDSYAARTGRRDHIGVIGVAAFRERRRMPRNWSPPVARPSAAAEPEMATADRAHAPAARQSIGTGHGTQEWSPVGRTAFARASARPAQITELRYDAPERLAALGIPVSPSRYAGPTRPRAFPGGFVPDPH